MRQAGFDATTLSGPTTTVTAVAAYAASETRSEMLAMPAALSRPAITHSATAVAVTAIVVSWRARDFDRTKFAGAERLERMVARQRT